MKIKINDYKIFDAIRPDIADLVESLLCRVDVRRQIPQIGDLIDCAKSQDDRINNLEAEVTRLTELTRLLSKIETLETMTNNQQK